MLHFESNKARRINPKQKQILYSAMATNRKILDCISGDSDVRRTRKAVWKRVAQELNNAGPAKDITQWRKVWTDLRLGMRKKWEKAQRNQYILTEYERRVISGCGMVEKPGDECFDDNSAEDINSFLEFLENDLSKEHKSFEECSDYSSQYQQYVEDSNEFIICQPTSINFKEEFDEDEEPNNSVFISDDEELASKFEQHGENSIECISDDEKQTTHRIKIKEPNNSLKYEEPSAHISDDEEQASTYEEFRENSIECISDDEEQTTLRLKNESPAHMSYEESHPSPSVPRPISLETLTVPRPIPIEKETVPQPILLQCIPSGSSSSNKINLTKRKKLKNAALKEIKKMHRNLLRESKKQTALLKKLVQGMQK